MKKIYLVLVLCVVMFSLTSCKNKYEISENADLLEVEYDFYDGENVPVTE